MPSHKTRRSNPLKNTKVRQGKFEKVLSEYKHGKLHSGSKHGPQVKSRKQAIGYLFFIYINK